MGPGVSGPCATTETIVAARRREIVNNFEKGRAKLRFFMGLCKPRKTRHAAMCGLSNRQKEVKQTVPGFLPVSGQEFPLPPRSAHRILTTRFSIRIHPCLQSQSRTSAHIPP
jgi:hypothetical protein